MLLADCPLPRKSCARATSVGARGVLLSNVTIGWGAAAQDLSVRLVEEDEWSQEGQELVSSMRASLQAGQAPAIDGDAAGGQEQGGDAGEGDWVRYDIPFRL